MLSINDLKPKMIVLIDGGPYQILEVKHLHLGRGGSSIQTKIKNLVTGQVFLRNFKPADTFEEAEIEKRPLVYIYFHPVRSKASNGASRGEFVFSAKNNSAQRFTLKAAALGQTIKWLRPKCEVGGIFLSGELVGVSLPIKMDFLVSEAPAGIKGDRVEGGSKTVIIETGTKISAPLFINEGDVIRVNTENGEYVERVAKAGDKRQ